MTNQVIIDYLAFTVQNDSDFELVGKAKELHSFLESFCSKYCSSLNPYTGGHLYTKGYMSFDGFRTYYGGEHTGRTLFIQISGAGCIILDRYFDGGLLGFLFYLLKYNPKIKRIDLAADEIGEANESDEYFLYPNVLDYYARHGLCTGSARKVNPVGERNMLGQLISGFTLYVGSRKSDAFIRIYDKKSEQCINGPGHWMRCELELHDNKASQVFIYLTSAEDYSVKIKELYTGICLDLIRFIDERKSNVTRSDTSEWWTDFLDGCEVTHKFTQKKEYKTIDGLMQWVDRSVLGALKVVYDTYGFGHLYKMMNEFVKSGRLSAAHIHMIDEFNKEEQRLFDERNECIKTLPDRAKPPQQQFQYIEVL